MAYIVPMHVKPKFTYLLTYFADDSNHFKNGKSISDIENNLNAELSEIVRWLKMNTLILNVDKM